ncbi:MAG: DNA recombination protein RmuC, partial [Bacteroidota bacterium]
MENLILLFAGAITGAAIAWLVSKVSLSKKYVTRAELDRQSEIASKYQSAALVYEERITGVQENLRKKENELVTLRRETDQLSINRQQEIVELQKAIASLKEQNKFLCEKISNQKVELEETARKFNTEFQNLANRILEEKSARFTEINQNNMKGLLEPLGENIREFRKKVEETYDKESKQRFSLEDRIKELVTLNQKISQEANNLTRALKGEAKKQGDWGEMILENILEKSGLVKDREYFVQEFLRDQNGDPLKNESGERMRPDVIVAYPGDKKIIIDSKVSLLAYERYCSCDVKEEQEQYLKEHVQAVRNHIDGLSSRNYQDYASSLDFVMLFVPIEPAYLTVMQKDPELWNYAYRKRILLISPTNLIAALKLVLDLWKREYQNRNAMEIAERGGQLYDKFVSLYETLRVLGDNIEKTQKSYNTAMNQLQEGKGNLIGQVEKLRELGAKTKKNQELGLKSLS